YLSRHTIAPRPRSVWLHERVLDALMRRHAVLPLRFATIVPDVDMLRNRLRPIYHALITHSPATFSVCVARSDSACASPASMANARTRATLNPRAVPRRR